MTFTVPEKVAVGSFIGQLIVAAEVGPSFTDTAVWSVVSCPQASTCTTVGLSGNGTLYWLKSPDYEVKGSVAYAFTIRVTIIGGLLEQTS